ncbi:hypothetical protein WJX79_008100 [Trebouxia sp. C0005]
MGRNSRYTANLTALPHFLLEDGAMRLCIRHATVAMCVAVSLLSSCGRLAWAQAPSAAPSCSSLGLPATAPTNGASYVKCQSFGGANWCQSGAAPGWDVCPVINGQTSPAPDPVLSATAAKAVVISEVQAVNSGTITNSLGNSPSWVELFNPTSSAVNLQGYSLSTSSNQAFNFQFPSVSIPAGGYQLVYVTGKTTAAQAGSDVLTSLTLSKNGGSVVLLDGSGNIASAVYYPSLAISDQSYGIATETVAPVTGPAYSFLDKATPKAANSGPSTSLAASISGVTNSPDPRPQGGAAIPVTAFVLPNTAAVGTVQLTYLVNYGSPVTIPMTAAAGSYQYSATIPSSAVTAGSLVRWYVQAMGSGGTARQPETGKGKDAPQYFGTVVYDPSSASNLPVLEWYCPSTAAAISVNGTSGCSIYFLGRFYDNLSSKRRGVSSLGFPKPKLHLGLDDVDFVYQIGNPSVTTVKTNGLYYEPGEKSYMRETIAYQVLGQAGVPYSVDFHMVVRQNGQYYGLFTFVEDTDDQFLMRNGLSTDGPMVKALDGVYANLRWDIGVSSYPFYWTTLNHKGSATATYQLLSDFAVGVAGGGGISRADYIYDNVNLPEVIENMAVQTLLLNQDRCTKNYNMYYDKTGTQEWQMLPWDLEESLGISSGLGGQPAPDYCILECQQWNSPLYCDWNHTQDISNVSPWSQITAQFNLFNSGSSNSSTPSASTAGRRLLHKPDHLAQAAAMQAADGRLQSTAGRSLLQSVNSSYPDFEAADTTTSDLTKEGPTPTGPESTFNYLIDALLAVPDLRSMYLRRLRSIMDEYTNGKLAGLITTLYNNIKTEAEKDNAKWGINDITRGYTQLIQDQLPERKGQLYSTYGPGGAVPLIPEAQSGSPPLSVQTLDTSDGSGQYVQIFNGNSMAVDVSGYKLQGSTSLTLQPGTVIAAGQSLYLSPNVTAFRARGSSPTGKQGLQVQGSYSPSLSSGANVQLTDASGNVLDSKSG